MASRVIEVLLESGELEGIKTIYPSNTSIVATIISRADVAKIKHIELKDNPGIYILVGMENLNTYTIYIGESDTVGKRILDHCKKDTKDFFTEILFFTSNNKDSTTISKSHIKFIENKLFQMAKQSPSIKLTETQTTPQKPQISRTDEAKAEEFLVHILHILKAIGYDLFIPTSTTEVLNETKAIKEKDVSATVPTYTYKVNNAVGKMSVLSGNYILLKGSTLAKTYWNSADQSLKNRREDLIQRGIIKTDNDLLIVLEDIPNKSSSAAAQLVCGGNEAGPRVWKDKSGKSLKDREETYL